MRSRPAAAPVTPQSAAPACLMRGALDTVTGNIARLGWAETQRSVRENAGNLVLTVSRIGNTSQAVAANVLAITGTAQSGVDFGTPYPASPSWAANDLSDRTVVVPIIYRSGVQSTRAFTVRLQGNVGRHPGAVADVVNVSIADVDCASDTPIGFGETKAVSSMQHFPRTTATVAPEAATTTPYATASKDRLGTSSQLI